MTATNIRTTFEIPVNINTPDQFGRILSEDAVVEAVRHMEGVPICVGVRNIGVVEAAYISSVQDNCVTVRVFGNIPRGGISYMKNDQDNMGSSSIDISEVYLFE